MKTIEDGFERSSLIENNAWDLLPMSTSGQGVEIGFDTTSSKTGAKSLRLSTTDRSGGGGAPLLTSFFQESLNTSDCVVKLELDLAVEAMPQASESLAIASMEIGGSTISSTVYLELTNTSLVGYERTSMGATSSLKTMPLPASGQWTHLEIILGRTPNPTITLLEDGTAAILTPMADGTLTVKNVRFGMVNSSPKAAATVRFDNVTLH